MHDYKTKVWAYLQLMRPANLVTAVGDVLAGFAIAGYVGLLFDSPFLSNHQYIDLLLLCIATVGLYGGGVVMNDVFDYKIDQVERPERPIPSGRATVNGAVLLSLVLFVVAVSLSFCVSLASGYVALAVIFSALLYDKYGKHTALGPINMGICRGLNLILGMYCSYHLWYLAFLPIIYIAAITLISKGEVFGSNKTHFLLSFLMYGTVVVAMAWLIANGHVGNRIFASGFLVIFCYFIFATLYKASRSNLPADIRTAVKTGVVSLLLLNATLGCSFAGWPWGLAIACLLPISIFLSRKFAVT